MVGGDAGGDEDAGAAVGGYEVMGEFGKGSVGVDIAFAGEWEAATVTNVIQSIFSVGFGVKVALIEFGLGFFQLGDFLTSLCGGDGGGDFGGDGIEEFSFL